MNSVRTISATKAAFFSTYSRPVNSIYRRIVEELLVELHLVTVNSQFVYDPFFALGLITVYDTLLDAYQPEDQRELIFTALCKALQLKPEVLRQDAKRLLDLLKTGDPTLRLKLLQQNPEAEDLGGIRAILDRIGTTKEFAYSRVLVLGLYTAFEAVALSLHPDLEERTQRFIEDVGQPLHFSAERMKKDLDLYRSSLERMKQARAVMEEMVKAARRQQERRNAVSTPPAAEAQPADTPDKGL